MLENMNDFMSIFVVGLMIVFGLWEMFVVLDSHHADYLRQREENYHELYDELNDQDDNSDEMYYE